MIKELRKKIRFYSLMSLIFTCFRKFISYNEIIAGDFLISLNLPRKYFYKAPLLFHGLDKYSFTCIASI